MKTIVFLDDYESAALSCADWTALDARAQLRIHQQPLRGDSLLGALRPAHAVVLMRDRTPMSAELIEALPNLELLIFTGTRNNALDFAALHRRGIPVCFTEWGPSKESTCELAWTLIFAAAKRLPQGLEALRSGAWRDGGALPGVLHGERLGLVGLGEIGARVARVGSALGMEVVAWSPRMTAERAAAHGATAVTLDELTRSSKVLSLHLVLTPETRHLFDAARFAQMRPDSIFVNTSRAGLADEMALVEALRAGRPAAAALDVYGTEPLPADHPLRSARNAVLSPHLGFVSQQVFERFYRDAAQALAAWLDGRPLPRQVPAPTA